MTHGEKLAKLRKEHHYTQEQLAEQLGVSRQAISKWEGNLAYPETDKLIRLGELYGCSLDYLLKDGLEEDRPVAPIVHRRLRERKSERTLYGMPLWHVGKKARGVVAVGLSARGIIAIGVKAQGLISFGVLSLGLLSFGTLSLGLIAAGLLAIGGLAAGCFAVGAFATGAICLGLVSLGAVAVGDFSVGALAIGKYAALGDNARAMIALGDSEAIGSVYQTCGRLTAQEAEQVRLLLDQVTPGWLGWAKAFFGLFL